MVQHLCGWQKQPDHIVKGMMADLPIPLFSQIHSELKGFGEGKDILLSDAVTKVMGKMFLFHQLGPDCVSMGTSGAAIFLGCVQACIDPTQSFDVIPATETIYGFSRCLPDLGNGCFGSGGGSAGIYGAKLLNRHGLIPRKNYTEFGIDLSEYDVKKALSYGASLNNCPMQLLPEGKDHLVKTISQVRNFSEASDAIAAGYPIIICSNVSFDSMTRDKMGFIEVGGRNWPHCMVLFGVKHSQRKGLACLNSWGQWIVGPYAHMDELPDGAFYLDENAANDIFSQSDSWVISSLESYPARELNLRLV